MCSFLHTIIPIIRDNKVGLLTLNQGNLTIGEGSVQLTSLH
jgi:hypothetical protein